MSSNVKGYDVNGKIIHDFIDVFHTKYIYIYSTLILVDMPSKIGSEHKKAEGGRFKPGGGGALTYMSSTGIYASVKTTLLS